MKLSIASLWRRLALVTIAPLLATCASLRGDDAVVATRKPTSFPAPPGVAAPDDPFAPPVTRAEFREAVVVEPPAQGYNDTPDVRITGYRVPEPKGRFDADGKRQAPLTWAYDESASPEGLDQTRVWDNSGAFTAQTFDGDAAASGFYHIPPDPHIAAGPNELVTVTNTSIQIRAKTGAPPATILNQSLQAFFGNVPTTGTFDPKVVYDTFAQRWVVVTLEQIPSSTSFIYIAVSDDSNPAGTWYTTRINSLETIDGQVSWLDYPGLAVDEEAIYITGNMFQFAAPGSFRGQRLFIVPKGLGTGGLYDAGGTATASRFNPVGSTGGVALTLQPARIIGTPPTDNVGTWLVGYSQLNSGVNAFLQIIRINNPLGTPTFSLSFVSMGPVSTFGAFPDAPQSGSAQLVLTNDPRSLDAVWRDNSLWTAHSDMPSAAPNVGQVTAHWVRLNALPLSTPTVAEQGDIGGEDIAAGAFTFFPAISTNAWNQAAVGFSASAATIFPGAYAVTRRPTDAAGTMSATTTVKSGVAFYNRRFGLTNRWGDYSGLATDPVTQCFWAFNEWADTRGTILGSFPTEDGRWATSVRRLCVCRGDESSTSADTDFDGICANLDNCPSVSNNNQSNLDGDALGDACDPCPSNPAAGCAAPSADVAISKSNGTNGVTRGSLTTYTIQLVNLSTNAISNVSVTDNFPASLVGCYWSCTAGTGSSCRDAFGSGNIATSLVLAALGSASFQATCKVSNSASGNIANTATVAYGNDPNGGNNSATDTDPVLVQADLSIAKSDGATSVNAGGTVTYAIVVTNPVASVVAGATVTDTFGANLQSCSWTCAASAGGSCASNGSGNIAAQPITLGASGTVTFTATCAVAAGATGTLSNTATVAYANDPNTANNSASDTNTAIVPQGDVAVTKTDGLTSVNAGASVAWTITVANLSPVALANVTVSDTFPASVTGCTWTCTAGSGSTCNANGSGNLSAQPVTLAASGSVTFVATCTVAAGASGTLANTATVSYANDPVPGNNSATDNNTVIVPQANLSITKTDGLTSVNAGSNVVYTIVVTNPSANSVSNATVADTFALAGCTWTCAASGSGSCTNASGAGNLSQALTLAPGGGTATITATCPVPASATGTLANTATITYANDPTPGNNTATDNNTVVVPQANLSITKSDGVTSVNAGGNVVYTIVVTNPSPNAIANATVTDAFPLTGCTWSCVASAGGSCTANGSGNINQSVALAGNGGTATFTATCPVPAAATGTLSNTATVAYANDPVSGNNSATDADTAIVSAADLSITKSDGTTSTLPGVPLTYTIVVFNPSVAAVSGVAVADTFPAALTGCTWTCTATGAGTCPANGSGNIATNVSLASLGSATFTATCTLSAAATGSVSNTATVTYANDPSPANNSATDVDTILTDDVFENGFE